MKCEYMCFILIADANCCPKEVARALYGDNFTPANEDFIRRLLASQRADICQQIENMNDPVYGEDVCMNHVRSQLAEQHQCIPGAHSQMYSLYIFV